MLYSCNDGKEISKRSVIHVQSFRFANLNLSLFGRCRRRRCCLSSPLSRGRGAGGGGRGVLVLNVNICNVFNPTWVMLKELLSTKLQ